ncbi:hypothetical protein HMPREF3048_00040 [Corynebacterium sp. HMSC075D04]|uniref:hypothetical protein n=1 Tax=Corynebacterium sp. HMSC075D04 TaxID=1739540 RepID=UPI0008A4F273|nr:hypothetical protein [Corynebacterium sp. HMSC075D04]OFO37441.1 hypothetical protein HMPREF3048_00040 [Corynebacterium sp. HMSC075D04]
MQWGFTRYEFAPTDVGGPITDARVIARIEGEFRALGWEQCTEVFGTRDQALLLPRTYAIVSKGDTLLYLSQSGYGVARYQFDYRADIGEEPVASVANALRDRVLFQQSLSDSPDEAVREVEELIRRIRKIQERYRRELFRGSANDAVHEYSFSVYAVSEPVDDRLVHALLHPRDVGCSLGLDQANLPSTNHLVDRINGTIPNLPCPIIDSQGHRFWSSWSASVIGVSCSGLEELVSLSEFRVQSTWLAAHKTAKMAAQVDLADLDSKGSSKMRFLQSDFVLVVARHRERLGAHSPALHSSLLDEINRSSDLDAEIARAETNLESAVATMAYYDERSNLKGRRLIEFAAWVFGVAGLAELLVELPLRPNTFATHPFSFAAWLLLATVGGIVVFRQR